MSKTFKNLLKPGFIGTVRVKNRIIKNGTYLSFDNKEEKFMTDRAIAFYETLAKGGVGLIVVEVGNIDSPRALPPIGGFRIDDDIFISGYRRLTEAIHKFDCPAFIQFFHLGPMYPSHITGLKPLSSSFIPKEELPRPQFEPARELTIKEIEEIIEKFVKAAQRANKAGFDGIELNAATNHLLNSFLSRAWNRRKDKYGIGSFENRARIVVEIISEIKNTIGKDFSIIVLMNGLEAGLKDGITIEEAREFAKIFEKAGADAIHVRVEFYVWVEDNNLRNSTHFPDLYVYPEPPKNAPPILDLSRNGKGATLPIARAIKQVVKIPVIGVGRLDPFLGEEAIEKGFVDFISLNRRLLADPELPNKIASGRIEDIAPCTACMTCFDEVEHFRPARCRINASLGKERESIIEKAEKRKKVVVVGAGPAGLEAARVAALRGHDVILVEKERKIGGLMCVASLIKGFKRENLLEMIRYFENQLRNLGVKLMLGKKADKGLIEQLKPDVLILATGAIHENPSLYGIDNPKVIRSHVLYKKVQRYLRIFGPKLLSLLSYLWMPLGENVVIVGGGIQGVQLAEFLVKRGRKVTIIEETGEIGFGLPDIIKPFLINWLLEKGVRIFKEMKPLKVENDGFYAQSKEGKTMIFEADNIIILTRALPDPSIAKSFEGKAERIYSIGDLRSPGLLIDAIADGFEVARRI